MVSDLETFNNRPLTLIMTVRPWSFSGQSWRKEQHQLSDLRTFEQSTASQSRVRFLTVGT